MNARAESNIDWLNSLTPALAKIHAERDAEISQFHRRHAEALAECMERRAEYKAHGHNKGWTGSEAVRLGSLWTNALASLMHLRSEIADAGYELEQLPRETWDYFA